ncbi:hypothetical protein LJR225_002410 [Phenylobacterium sp. LjRoot225]|uniref:hypothetical protein n=1 Tax=Phenylobacterium sp. LjRoot225 TaxID=3342285 RepID=UPI003ED0E1C0
MAFRLTQLNETNRPAFEALLEHAWGQNWGPDLARALIRWRYYDRPSGGGTWLASSGGQCVAMLDSFVRPYLLDGRRILVREGSDWYCLPKYRPLGLGVRLMREMMACPEPMISIGGSDATVAMLPRLRWTRLPDVQKYVLPIKARSLAGTLLRNRWPAGEGWARAIPGFIPLRRPRRSAAAPIGVGRVAEWRPGTPAVLPAPQHRGLVQLLDQVDQDWRARMPPGVAQQLGLVFFLDDTPVGFSLSQIEPAITGFDGCIVHLEAAHQAQAVVDWVVAETASRLAARGVGIIRCSASSPEKGVALRKVGFVATGALPSYWWPKTGVPTPSGTDAGYLRADDAIPFPALRGRHMATSWGGSHRVLSSTGAAP